MSKSEMESKFRELHYYCICWGTGNQSEEPTYVDIMLCFDGASFYDCIETYKSITSYEDLRHWVSMILKSKFHFRAEWEMNLSNLFNNEDLHKHDIWDQVAPNIDIIVDMINNAFNLGFEKTPVKKETPLTISYRGQ